MNRVQSEKMQRILFLDRRYELNECYGRLGEGRNFETHEGSVPVLVSAPHAVKQLRNGRMKLQDGMTGGIVEYLAERFKLYRITRIWSANDDPNFADDERSAAYREEVARIIETAGIEWVFDIHGCRDEHGFDMDIGINNGGNLACGREEIEELVDFWRDEGLDVRIDERFRAARLNVVSNYAHRRTGVNCLQVELAGSVRKGNEKMERFLRGFERTLKKLLAAEGKPCQR